MHDADTVSRVRKAESDGRTPASTPYGLPRSLVLQGAHRVGTAALTWAGAYIVAIALNEYAAHTIGDLPPHGWNFGHTVAALFVGLSIGIYALSRSGRLPPERVLDAGLLFEVVGGFMIVVGTSEGMVWDERAHILGLPWICVWIAGYPFIVPATPRKAGTVAFITALMAPAGLATWHLMTGTPMPSSRVWSGITIPTFICAAMATIGSRIVYGLGRDIQRAAAMGSYRLEERLGAGGMGEVWRARHRMLTRPAAIKLVRLDAFPDPAAREAAVVRFEREAQVTAQLTSPHTVRLYDFGVTDGGTFYYAMELLEGMDLETLVKKEGPVPPPRAVHFLIQACRSLAEAHELGMVHRDIKPANLFVCRQGREFDFLKVLDFGLVRPEQSTRLTGQFAVVGTPAYMAPETIEGGQIGNRTDLYALGCVAYWLVTGKQVFEGKTPIEVVTKHVHDAPVPPRTRAPNGVPPALDAVILRCLEKDPARRPESADALRHALEVMALDEDRVR